MSITTNVTSGSDSPDAEQQGNKGGWFSTLDTVKKYIRALPGPFGDVLSEHVVHESHEDVPNGAFQAPEGFVSQSDTDGSYASSFESQISPIPLLLPPINFGTVEKSSVYRSGYPRVENHGFLKSLGLKTILTLVPGELSPQYRAFMAENGIQHFQVHIPANKGEISIGACEMSRALEIVLDRSNHPMLIHCNKGKHRTGCTVGCLRRVQGDNLETVCSEYHSFANPKARLLDEVFIEQFNENTVMWMARRFGWAPPLTEIATPLSPAPTLGLGVARPRA